MLIYKILKIILNIHITLTTQIHSMFVVYFYLFSIIFLFDAFQSNMHILKLKLLLISKFKL